MIRKNPTSNVILSIIACIILLAGYIFCCAYSVFAMSTNMTAVEQDADGVYREVFSFTWGGFFKAATCLPAIIAGALALGMTFITIFKPSQSMLVKTGIVYIVFMVCMFISLSETAEITVAREFALLAYLMKGTGKLYKAFKFILPVVAFCVYCENIMLFSRRAKSMADEGDDGFSDAK